VAELALVATDAGYAGAALSEQDIEMVEASHDTRGQENAVLRSRFSV
jgi:hypothetical protein